MKKSPAINLSNIYRYLLMPAIVLLFTATTATANHRPLQLAADTTLEGRWDLTIMEDVKRFRPGWRSGIPERTGCLDILLEVVEVPVRFLALNMPVVK